MRKSKKFAITKLVLISVAVFLVMLLAVAQFGVPFTNYKYKSFAGAIKRGFDFDGGIYAVYDVSESEDKTNLDERLSASVIKLNEILSSNNLPDSTVVKVGEQVRVETSSLNNPSTLLELIGTPAKIEFQLGGVTKLTNKNIDKAYVSYDNQSAQYGIMVEFDSEGKALYKDLTSEAKKNNQTIAVTLSGEQTSDISINSITVTSRVTNGKQMLLSSSFNTNVNKAATLAIQIMTGSLDATLTLNKKDQIQAPMGLYAKAVIIAAAVAIVVGVVALMVVRFRAMGAMSAISFLLFAALYLLFLYSFPIGQLTLMGAVGVLGGVALAASIYWLLFSRLSEEYGSGKTVNASLTGAYSKILWAVLDSNILVAIAGIFFIILGGPAFKTMGIVLIMGIILSLLTSLLVNRFLIRNLITITPDNIKAYNLHRDEGVQEIPDEEITRAKPTKPTRTIEAEVVSEDVDGEINDTNANAVDKHSNEAIEPEIVDNNTGMNENTDSDNVASEEVNNAEGSSDEE